MEAFQVASIYRFQLFSRPWQHIPCNLMLGRWKFTFWNGPFSANMLVFRGGKCHISFIHWIAEWLARSIALLLRWSLAPKLPGAGTKKCRPNLGRTVSSSLRSQAQNICRMYHLDAQRQINYATSELFFRILSCPLMSFNTSTIFKWNWSQRKRSKFGVILFPNTNTKMKIILNPPPKKNAVVCRQVPLGGGLVTAQL